MANGIRSPSHKSSSSSRAVVAPSVSSANGRHIVLRSTSRPLSSSNAMGMRSLVKYPSDKQLTRKLPRGLRTARPVAAPTTAANTAPSAPSSFRTQAATIRAFAIEIFVQLYRVAVVRKLICSSRRVNIYALATFGRQAKICEQSSRLVPCALQ